MRGTSRDSFVNGYRGALEDRQLQRALSNATSRFIQARLDAVSSVGAEWEELRERARAVKEEALSRLDRLLEEFESNVRKNGGRVFWARDAEAAGTGTSSNSPATGESAWRSRANR